MSQPWRNWKPFTLHHLLKDTCEPSTFVKPCTMHPSPITFHSSPFKHHPSPFTHHLKEHANDGHHRQSSVCQLCIELCFLDLRISRCDELPSKVTSCSRSSSRLVLGNFAEGHVGQNLTPTCCWHFGDRGKTIGHVCKLQASRRRQVAREFAGDFRCNISHRCEHRNATMLQLSLTTSLEVLNTAIRREPSWIPETHRSLHTQLILKGTQRRSSVVGPVTPSTSGQAILRGVSDIQPTHPKNDMVSNAYSIQYTKCTW